MNEKLMPEFTEWVKAHEEIRAWVDANPGQPVPRFLMDRLDLTYVDYAKSNSANSAEREE